MNLFVTGVDGYIGAVLARRLIGRGHHVVGLDTGFYRRGWWYTTPGEPVPATRTLDVRHIEPADLSGCDAVIHLAELSNDPLGELSPDVTMAINHSGSVRLAQLARAAGVPRFVYSSSCSVYGAATSDWLSEGDAVSPQTTYARCKVLVEEALLAMADRSFSPVCLRNATAYGASPRMRFDLVVNNLAALAATTRHIAMTSDGTPWRPLVHVRDICRAIECAIESPPDVVRGQVFNVGRNDQNFRVRDIAGAVGEAFPDCDVTTGPSAGDRRSYRVSFDRVHDGLPGFTCEWDLGRGIAELRDVFHRVGFTQDQFTYRPFTRLEELKYLVASGQVDDDLFWSA